MKKLYALIFAIIVTSVFNNSHAQLWKQYLDSAKVYTVYSDQNKIDSAIQLYLKAKKELEKDSIWSEGHAQVCHNLASLYTFKSQYKKAEPLWLKAKQINEKIFGKRNLKYALSSNGLAALYFFMGQFEKAEPLWLEVKQLRKDILGKEDPVYAQSCNNLARLYATMLQYEKAEALYLEAKQIMEIKLGKKGPNYATICLNLGEFYSDMGQHEKAEPLYLEARQIIEDTLGKGHPDYATSCEDLANLYTAIKQYEKAEPLYLEARQIRKTALGENHPLYAINCYKLSILYRDRGQYEKAEQYAIESKEITKNNYGKENYGYAASCDLLAILYYEQSQYKKAEPFFLEAKNIGEKIFGREHPSYAKSCHHLAFLYRNMRNPKMANDYFSEAFKSQNIQLKKVFKFTSEAEKQLYVNNNSIEANNFFSFYSTDYFPSHQGFSYDVSLFNRNLFLSFSLLLRKSIFNINDTSVKKKYANWINSREQIAYWYLKPIINRPSYLRDLEEESNSLEKELTRLSSDFRSDYLNKDVSWKNIQQNLKTKEAAIEFVEFNYHNGKRWTDSTYYIALVLRKDKPEPVMVRLFEKKQLDTLLNPSEYTTTDRRINALYTKNKSLYNLTWKPLEKYLEGISKIFFASAGNLFKISFAALQVNDDKLLGDKYELVQLNSTATVTSNTQSLITASDKIQLYGGISYDADSVTLKQAVSAYQANQASNVSSRSLPADLTSAEVFKYLPGTRQEAEEIKKQAVNINLPVSILSGTNAIEESFKALNGKNSPSVLHIATHGFFFPDPKKVKPDEVQRKFETSGKAFKQSDNPLFRSGLLFAGANNAWQEKHFEGIEDGILTAYEVSNMYLPNTKLVVLSACETALGDIQGSEGVYGLQRAFKIAGELYLVMSLWKVPDVETVEFMQLFYKNLFTKQTIDQAFYNTQQVMKNKYRAEPYKWAAWILVR